MDTSFAWAFYPQIHFAPVVYTFDQSCIHSTKVFVGRVMFRAILEFIDCSPFTSFTNFHLKYPQTASFYSSVHSSLQTPVEFHGFQIFLISVFSIPLSSDFESDLLGNACRWWSSGSGGLLRMISDLLAGDHLAKLIISMSK